jgi:LIVCS family branched-chain amino acid:cation transporter
MFFGSGNLVFPLSVGVNSAENWIFGFLGFFCTGIILPFLGLFVIKLYKGNYNDFFGEAGIVAKYAIPIFTLSLLGSFGVIPRCITVSHGGIEYLFPGTSLLWFSVIFCIACFVICLNDRFMLAILGKFLTPILLVFLSILICLGVYQAPAVSAVGVSTASAFESGFLQGYSTMDLFAAFFFSALIFKQIELSGEVSAQNIIRAALKPSIIGATILALVYFGFVFLGSHYKDIANEVTPELVLPAISMHLLGKAGGLFIAVTILLSCFTTAIALNSIYARYICSFKFIGDEKFPLILFCTTLISFMISLLDFNGIALILSPLLNGSYPALIALTILSIFVRGHKTLKAIVFYGLILIVLVF